MPGTVQTRIQLKEAYDNSPKWVKKVDAMSDKQALAVYLRLRMQGRI